MPIEFEQALGKFLTSTGIATEITKLASERGLMVNRCRFEEKTKKEQADDPRPNLRRTLLEPVIKIDPVTISNPYGVYLLIDSVDEVRYLFEFSTPTPVAGEAFHAKLSRITPETIQDEFCGLRENNLEGQVDFNSDRRGSLIENYGEMDPLLTAFFEKIKE